MAEEQHRDPNSDNADHQAKNVEENTTQKKDIVLLSCVSKGTVARASSVLHRNTKLYGPMNALDPNGASCWNSEGRRGGTAAWYQVEFHRWVEVQEIRLQFQGGFVGQECTLSEPHEELELEDGNELQVFSLRPPHPCPSLRLDFGSSTDFYGRITLYRIEIWGHEGAAPTARKT